MDVVKCPCTECKPSCDNEVPQWSSGVFCSYCTNGYHAKPRNDGVMDMTYRELSLAPNFIDDDTDYI